MNRQSSTLLELFLLLSGSFAGRVDPLPQTPTPTETESTHECDHPAGQSSQSKGQHAR